jgi:hypothetical protein
MLNLSEPVFNLYKVILDDSLPNGYQVINLRTGRAITCELINGYHKCRLYYNNKRYRTSVHRLIALQYIPNDQQLTKITVDHIDRNTSNNSISNLRWATYKEQANNRSVKP